MENSTKLGVLVSFMAFLQTANATAFNPSLAGCTSDISNAACWASGVLPSPGADVEFQTGQLTRYDVFNTTARRFGKASVNGDALRLDLAESLTVGQLVLGGDFFTPPGSRSSVDLANGAVDARTVSVGGGTTATGTTSGDLTVTGPNSTLNALDLSQQRTGAVQVGSPDGSSLTIIGGGTVSTNALNVATGVDYRGTVTIDGSGSGLSVLGRVSPSSTRLASEEGSVAELNIRNGGSFAADKQQLIGELGTAVVNVSGTNSSYFTDYNFNIRTVVGGGSSRPNASGDGTFNVTDGATADLSALVIGQALQTTGHGAVRGKMLIDGAGSTVNTRLGLDVGAGGSGEIEISNGGKLTGFSLGIGARTATSSGFVYGSGAVSVDGIGSEVALRGGLFIGDDDPTSNGSLTITNGGKVTSTAGFSIFVGDGGNGQLTVSGSGSLLDYQGDLNVAGNPFGNGPTGVGIVNVLDGATVNIGGGINLFDGAEVKLTDGVINTGFLRGVEYIDFDSGTINVAGQLSANSYLTGFNFSLGDHQELNVGGRTILQSSAGGSFAVEGGTFSTGSLELFDGVFIVDGGTFSAGSVKVFNSAQFEFRSGVLNITDTNSEVDIASIIGSGIGAGSTINLAGAAVVDPGETLQLDGNLNVGSLTNEGLIAFGGIDSTLTGTLNNSGAGSISVQAGSFISFAGDVINNGSGFFAQGSTIDFQGEYSGAGNLEGNFIFSGVLALGNSPAQVAIVGDATFADTLDNRIELQGTKRGIGESSEYDALDVTGTLELDGILNVILLGTFAPQANDVFDIFTAAAIEGAFDEILFNQAELTTPGLVWSWGLFEEGGLDIFRLMVLENADIPGGNVPSPSVLWLFLTGLLFVVFRRQVLRVGSR